MPQATASPATHTPPARTPAPCWDCKTPLHQPGRAVGNYRGIPTHADCAERLYAQDDAKRTNEQLTAAGAADDLYFYGA